MHGRFVFQGGISSSLLAYLSSFGGLNFILFAQ